MRYSGVASSGMVRRPKRIPRISESGVPQSGRGKGPPSFSRKTSRAEPAELIFQLHPGWTPPSHVACQVNPLEIAPTRPTADHPVKRRPHHEAVIGCVQRRRRWETGRHATWRYAILCASVPGDLQDPRSSPGAPRPFPPAHRALFPACSAPTRRACFPEAYVVNIPFINNFSGSTQNRFGLFSAC